MVNVATFGLNTRIILVCGNAKPTKTNTHITDNMEPRIMKIQDDRQNRIFVEKT